MECGIALIGPEPGKPGTGGAVPAVAPRKRDPGRPGTPPLRHYDRGARSSLTDDPDIMPGDEKRGPGRQKAAMERREARRSGDGSSTKGLVALFGAPSPSLFLAATGASSKRGVR